MGFKNTTTEAEPTKDQSGSSVQRFEFSDGKSHKFWQIEVTDESEHIVTYGRIGTKGQSKYKEFGTYEEAQADAAKLIASKTRKGYQKVSAASASKAAAATPPAASLPSSDDIASELGALFDEIPVDVGEVTLFFHDEYHDPMLAEFPDGSDMEFDMPSIVEAIKVRKIGYGQRYDLFRDNVVPVIKKLHKQGAFKRFADRGLAISIQHVDGSPEPVVEVSNAVASAPKSNIKASNPCARANYARTARFSGDTKGFSPQWITELPLWCDALHPLTDRLVGLGSEQSDSFVAFDLETREAIWKAKAEDLGSSSKPIVYDDTVIVAGDAGAYFLDMTDGKSVGCAKYPLNISNNRAHPMLVDGQLVIFNERSLLIIDVASQKRVGSVAYFGELTGWDSRKYMTEYSLAQQPPYVDDRFWLFTRKGKKQFLEGISLTEEPLRFELPKDVYVTTTAIEHNGALVFGSVDGHMYHLDLATGKPSRGPSLVTGTPEDDDELADYSTPAMIDKQFAVYETVRNVESFLRIVDVDNNTVQSIDVEKLSSDFSTVIAGDNAFYAIGAWHTVAKFADGKLVAHHKYTEKDFRSLEPSGFLHQGMLYALATREKADRNSSFRSAIVCLG